MKRLRLFQRTPQEENHEADHDAVDKEITALERRVREDRRRVRVATLAVQELAREDR